jgi:hypothetical protein
MPRAVADTGLLLQHAPDREVTGGEHRHLRVPLRQARGDQEGDLVEGAGKVRPLRIGAGMQPRPALVGAYVLAGEINRNPDDSPAAFAQYQATLKPFIEHVQDEVNPKLLRLGFPKGRLGITSIRAMGAVATFLRLPELAARFAKEDRGGYWPLPDYSQPLAAQHS